MFSKLEQRSTLEIKIPVICRGESNKQCYRQTKGYDIHECLFVIFYLSDYINKHWW